MGNTDAFAGSLWYKDAIVYEVHVRAFFDSDGNGIGDFAGLTAKLDYIQDLGVTAIWLLPFYPSPLKDDGYDISDYMNVHPTYGTLDEFKKFLREAHRRGLRVITELVLNHTSDQHPWFQRARRAQPGSKWRNFYVWSDQPDKYSEARIIFRDVEHSNWAWDPEAKAYYWHRFYSHQPDLNYDNPAVFDAVCGVLDYWLDLGVDGFRLDAVPYLCEREGTSCADLPETHEILKRLRRHVDARFNDRMLLAEANLWPEDAISYFGEGDECHMAFHFPLMPRIFMSIYMEECFPILDIIDQTPQIPDTGQWALFLRNHDELTLEMVTDEERDYMYRVYAQDPQARVNLGIRRRLSPLMRNNRRRIELINGLLFSLPGTPVIYYGDEIGMGDNIYLGDRNSVRTPMQWSADRNAGFSKANPQQLYMPVNIDPEYRFEAVNVEAQQGNPSSLHYWIKRVIGIRRRFKAFGRGSLESLHTDNRRVLAFIRKYENEVILIIANLSRYSQYAQLDLSQFIGRIPVELFGHIRFPAVGRSPYLLTLGPQSFYWFSLEQPRVEEVRLGQTPVDARQPVISTTGSWESVFGGTAKTALEESLPDYLQVRRWFGSRMRQIESATLIDSVPIPHNSSMTYVALFRTRYDDGSPETYVLTIAFATGEQAAEITKEHPQAVIAQLHTRGDDGQEIRGILYNALRDPAFTQTLLDAFAEERVFRGNRSQIVVSKTTAFDRSRGPMNNILVPTIWQAAETNTAVIYDDKLILKLFRRLSEGVSPDLEIGLYLTEEIGFSHSPSVAGAMEYRSDQGDEVTLAVLHSFVPNQSDAWQYTLDYLTEYYERALTHQREVVALRLPSKSLLALSVNDAPQFAAETVGAYLALAKLFGQRTAEFHLALASPTGDPNFAPEPFSGAYRRSAYQSMRSTTNRSLRLLEGRKKHLPDEVQEDARKVLGYESQIEERFRSILGRDLAAYRIRCHGDFHLGQVLYTGKDFYVIDFEGEPGRSLSERRAKGSPLRDVAGMLRSFHYAATFSLADSIENGLIRREDRSLLQSWARFWQLLTSAEYLNSYLEVVGESHLLPSSQEDTEFLLNIYTLEKAVFELGFELQNRPELAWIPLQSIVQMMETPN